MDPRGQFNPSEFAATIERLRASMGHGDMGTLRPDFDPKLDADVAADAVRGRRIEDYKVALEALGFRYTPAERLPPYRDQWGRVVGFHTDGEWRCERLRAAFTDREVLRRFASPEEFVTWMEQVVTAKRLAASGLYLGKDQRGRQQLMNRRARRRH
jgi:hypothetical protein